MNIEKLYPAFKDYVWGGEKLKKLYGKETGCSPLAESWELSFHKDGLTHLCDGRPLSEVAGEDALGENACGFSHFPVLIKFIDALNDLSVQVHPSDEYALEKENSLGKTETWYIVEADEGAGIYLGFNREVTKEEYEAAIAENRLTELLNFYPVKAGESYFIPSGTIHAIGKGCLIYEIQQNSNLTYRVYDYGRKDANGNCRQLHVEKALDVTRLEKHTMAAPIKNFVGISKYFDARRITVKEKTILIPDKSFHCITCVSGEGEIDGATVKRGDSFFVPADHGEYYVSGDMVMILTQIRKYYIGIDLGGTFIKGGIVSDLGEIIVSHKIPTESALGAERVAENIASMCTTLLEMTNMTASDVIGIGIGVPGMIDSEKGEVVYSNNLAWEHFPISKRVSDLVGLPIKIANDANVAALGEAKFGCGKNYSDTVMLTLGTGVGGGIVIGGRLFEGHRSAGAELGHAVICAGGEQCTCGRRGCLEAYASATALIRDTKRAMEKDKTSKMWEIGSLDAVNGETAFKYKDCDETAKTVVDGYIDMLAVGITNLSNEFRPEAIILGGGVCAEGDNLLIPLRRRVEKDIFAGTKGPGVEIIAATLGNSAGILGAAALWI